MVAQFPKTYPDKQTSPLILATYHSMGYAATKCSREWYSRTGDQSL